MKKLNEAEQQEILKDLGERFSFLSTGDKQIDSNIAQVAGMFVKSAQIAILDEAKERETAKFLDRMEEAFIYLKEGFMRKLRDKYLSEQVAEEKSNIITPPGFDGQS